MSLFPTDLPSKDPDSKPNSEDPPRKSGVYFISCECLDGKFVKIGRSRDVERRRRELQTGCPFQLRIEHVEEMDDANAEQCERQWLTGFKNLRSRMRTEWHLADAPRDGTQLMLNWFPYANKIKGFVEALKNNDQAARKSIERAWAHPTLFGDEDAET